MSFQCAFRARFRAGPFLFPDAVPCCEELGRLRDRKAAVVMTDSKPGGRRRRSAARPAGSRDERFRTLLALAREGDEAATHGLWIEFDFDYAKEGGRYE